MRDPEVLSGLPREEEVSARADGEVRAVSVAQDGDDRACKV